jgi:hypothetical protein
VRFSEWKQVTDCARQKYIQSVSNPEYKLALRYCQSKMDADGKEKEIKEDYIRSYKDGYFAEDLQLKNEDPKKKKK